MIKVRFPIVAAIAAAIAVTAMLVAYTPVRAEDAQWTAEYFNNMKLTGSPEVTQLEDSINYRWGTASPIPGTINPNRFSVRWTRVVNFAEDTYVFTTRSDDGIRVWIDDHKIIDQWDDHPIQTYFVVRDVDAGEHTLKVEYYENKAFATAGFSWAPLRNNPWTAQYFNGTGLSGNVRLEQDENSITNFWGGASPAPNVTAKNFSVRWTRTVSFAGGDYKFVVTVSDGVRVYVGNNLVLDKWYDHGVQKHKVTTHINAGNRVVRVEFYNHSYPAVILFKMRPG